MCPISSAIQYENLLQKHVQSKKTLKIACLYKQETNSNFKLCVPWGLDLMFDFYYISKRANKGNSLYLHTSSKFYRIVYRLAIHAITRFYSQLSDN